MSSHLRVRRFTLVCALQNQQIAWVTTSREKAGVGVGGESRISAKNRRSLHIFRSHRATDVGSNRTQVPIRNDGILPAFACLKIVILETVNMLASSSAVKARPIRSIRSANDKGSAVLFSDFHSISLLNWIYCAATAAYYFWTVVRSENHVFS